MAHLDEQTLIDTWAEALERAVFAIPRPLQERVFATILKNQRERPGAITYAEIVADNKDYPPHQAVDEAASIIVQILVRSIAKYNSEEDAARILYHEHPLGTGWLPASLKYLPGIKIDEKKCGEISESAPKTRLL